MNGAHAVPDPELTLIDSNFIELNKLQLLFRPSRKYTASTHFIRVRVPFNFLQLLQTPDNIFEQYHNYIQLWPEPFRTQVEQVAKVSRSCLADKINDFVDILDALPQHTIVTRDKHFLDLVALGISMAALSLSTYNSARISTLEMQIISNNKSGHLQLTRATFQGGRPKTQQHLRQTGKDSEDQQGPFRKIDRLYGAKIWHHHL